ncbi:hypothetical protein TNCV_2066391 [Trichonephila clavipes]|nr:hypothetical protein TNCV_2066391 [Trichonephila clavipes]
MISSDSNVETLYDGQRSSNGSIRSQPGKSKRCRKTSSEESKGRKSNKGNAGWEDPRLKRKEGSIGQWTGRIKSGPKYAGKDLCRGPNIGTRKDQPLNQHRG